MARILVVDDEKSIRFTLGEFLRQAGYQVDTAEDVAAAQTILGGGGVDIVVSDIVMPRLTGVELLHFIRTTAPRIQVILMTGEPSVDTASQAVRDGACEYLYKPITKDTLLQAVARAARIKALDDERERLQAANREYQRGLESLVGQRTVELKDANTRLQRTLEGTIHAAARIVESRDPYTAGHQQRVAQLAQAIARDLRLPEDQTRGVYLAGLIHDVGKIGIPAEMLSKPGTLTEIEIHFIRTHSEIGYGILKAIAFPWPIADTARQHHERLDGSGYPAGLKGEEIILEARILAVADVVEAMSSHRPYRPAMGIEKAVMEIRRGRGTIYDPEVGASCISLFEERGFAFDVAPK